MSPLQFSYGIDIESYLFRFPSPITLWDDACYAIVKMGWFSFGITCVTYFSYHRFLSDESSNMCIYFVQVGIVVESQARAEYQDAVTSFTKVVSCCHHNSTDSRVYVSSLLGKDVYSSMFVVAPRMPKRFWIVALLSTTFNWILDFSW